MSSYDDEQLGEYLSAFSDAGNAPSSLGGYGRQQFARPQPRLRSTALGALGADEQNPLTDKSGQFEQELVRQSNKAKAAADTARGARYGDLSVVGDGKRGPQVLVGNAWVPAEKVQVRSVRNALQLLGYPIAPGVKYGPDLKATWGQYAKLFSEKRAGFGQQPDNAGWVFMQPGAPSTLAAKAKAAGAGGKKAPTTTKAPSTGANVSASTDELQKIMLALGVDPENITDKKYGPTTKAKWLAAAKARGLNGTSSGRNGALTATVNRKALLAMRAAATAAAPVAASDQVITTGEAQGLLAALGFSAPGTKLTDGSYGTMTAGAWGQAATKRGLDPFMAKKTADGKQVVVRKNTYLMIKADADSNVAPREPEPTGLKTLGPDVVSMVPSTDLVNVVNRLFPPAQGGQPTPAPEKYARLAERQKLDPRIEMADKSGTAYYVITKTFLALDKLAAAMEPPKPPPGPQLSKMEQEIAAILEVSTGSVATATVRTAINAAVQAKTLATGVLPPGGWEPAMRGSVVKLLGISGPVAPSWENALVVGKLVSIDGKTLKLPPALAKSIKDLAASFKKAKKEEVARFKDFTEVSPPEIIARINNLGVAATKFDRAGGAKELAQAISVFIKESGGKDPKGEYVRTDAQTKKVYAKNSLLFVLALAVKAADDRAKKTQAFRDTMVANALQESSGFFPVRDLQQAIKHLVLSKQVAKPNVKLYSAVKVTGAFDAATRAAYTEIARTKTIGAAVQQYQAMLQKQLGPRFKAALVTEARNQVWNAFLDKAVHKKNGKLSISMIPAIGFPLAGAAEQYRKETEGTAQEQEQVAEQQKVLAAAVKKATAILSILDVQQGLLRMAGPAREKINTTGVRITGVADKATRDGLLQLSAMIFPEGYDLPETMWVAYLKAVGIKVVSGAQPVRTWLASNYIALPPDLANLLAKSAGEWIAKHGPPNVQVVKFNNPSVITVVVPKPKDTVLTEDDFTKEKMPETVKDRVKDIVSEEDATANVEDARIAREKAERDKAAADEAARLKADADAAEAAQQAELAAQQAEREHLAKEQDANAADQANQAAQAAALREQAARDAGRVRDAERAAAEARQAAAVAQAQMQAANEAADREQAARQQQSAQETAAAGGSSQAGGAHVTGPTISITTPQQAGMGMGTGMLVAGGLGLVALLALAAGDKREQQ